MPSDRPEMDQTTNTLPDRLTFAVYRGQIAKCEPTVSVPVSKLLELMDKTGRALPINEATVMDWLASVWPVETRMKGK